MTRRRILVVDDDESLRRVTEVQLQQAGYEVASAAGGEAALEMLQDAPRGPRHHGPKMPGISGLELLRRIRAGFPEPSSSW